MVNLQIKRSVKLSVDRSILLQAAQQTFVEANIAPSSEMSVVIGSDALLKRLNLKYRGINSTTDVLSFPSSETDPDTKALYLGDVVISLPRAHDQAAAGGHPLAEELQLLVVHGTLHLLGYDHLEKADKMKMQAIQDRILTRIGVNLTITL